MENIGYIEMKFNYQPNILGWLFDRIYLWPLYNYWNLYVSNRTMQASHVANPLNHVPLIISARRLGYIDFLKSQSVHQLKCIEDISAGIHIEKFAYLYYLSNLMDATFILYPCNTLVFLKCIFRYMQ